MKLKLIFLTVLVFCLSIVSCVDKKQKSLDDLRKFENELEMDSDSYTDEQWNEASTKYDQMTAELDRYKYTDEELREIGYLKGKCAGYFTKRTVKEIGEGLNSAAQQIAGAVRGFFDAINDGANDSMPDDDVVKSESE